MKNFQFKNLAVIAFVFFAFFAVTAINPAHAQNTPNPPIVNVNFPCPNCAQNPSDITTYLNTFYQFSLWIGGALALGMIVAGGVMRIVSAGSPDKIHEANDMITSAIFGLLLLFGAVLVLNTINPQLTLLKLPTANEQFVSGPQTDVQSLADTNCVAQNVKDFGNIAVWNGAQQYSSLNCIYRRDVLNNSQYNGATFVADNTYYDEDFTMPNGSVVWLYPYFTGTTPLQTAKCLIYAYKEPGVSSTVQMTPLNPNLHLCSPQYQSMDGPVCSEWTYTGVDGSGNQVTQKIAVSSSTFNYSDPSSPPPLTTTSTIENVGDSMYPVFQTITRYFCIGSDGKSTNSICTQSGSTPFWQCSTITKPTPTDQPNNVLINTCAGPCVNIANVLPEKSTGLTDCDKSVKDTNKNADGNCKLTSTLVEKLKVFKTKMATSNISWQVNEAWPPTVHHADYCHSIGTCADIAITSSPTCDNIQKTLDNLTASGIQIYNEYWNEHSTCTMNPPAHNPGTRTGDNLHIY